MAPSDVDQPVGGHDSPPARGGPVVRGPALPAQRPSLRPGDVVTLADHVATIPAYADKPAVLRDTRLVVAAVVGTGSRCSPYLVVVTGGGEHSWHFDPGDLEEMTP